MAQNRTSVAYRYRLTVNPGPRRSIDPNHVVSLASIADLAQAAQWVRCYQYQPCERPPAGKQRSHTTTAPRPSRAIVSKIIDAHDTTGTYNGLAAHLTQAVPSPTTGRGYGPRPLAHGPLLAQCPTDTT